MNVFFKYFTLVKTFLQSTRCPQKLLIDEIFHCVNLFLHLNLFIVWEFLRNKSGAFKMNEVSLYSSAKLKLNRNHLLWLHFILIIAFLRISTNTKGEYFHCLPQISQYMKYTVKKLFNGKWSTVSMMHYRTILYLMCHWFHLWGC